MKEGPTGPYGPNDLGYINELIRKAAGCIAKAMHIYCEGHYPHSNAIDLPEDHPLRIVMKGLAEVDKQTCSYANCEHDPKLFDIYQPPQANKTRWNK